MPHFTDPIYVYVVYEWIDGKLGPPIYFDDQVKMLDLVRGAPKGKYSVFQLQVANVREYRLD